MDAYKSEEEQIAAIKKWWNENGTSLLLGIGVAVLIIAGWKFYQTQQEQTMNAASLLYQQLLEVSAQQSPIVPEAEAEASSVDFIAQQIKQEHPETTYAVYAALFAAQEAVKSAELDKALGELDWAMSRTTDSALLSVASARKARVLAAQEKYDEALALVSGPVDTSFQAQYLELQGDINQRKGDDGAAIESYTEAYQLSKAQAQRNTLLRVKLASLGVNADEI